MCIQSNTSSNITAPILASSSGKTGSLVATFDSMIHDIDGKKISSPKGSADSSKYNIIMCNYMHVYLYVYISYSLHIIYYSNYKISNLKRTHTYITYTYITHTYITYTYITYTYD